MPNVVVPMGGNTGAARGRALHLTSLVRMLLWTPLGLWMAWPHVAEDFILQPPLLASPIPLKAVANSWKVQVSTVLLGGAANLWGTLLEAGRRAQVHPDKTDNRLAGRFGAVFAWRDAKSMNVWTSFDCLEALVWSVAVVYGWFGMEDSADINPTRIVVTFLCIIGPPVMIFVIKRVFAAVTYTQGGNMPTWVRGTATPLLAKAVCLLLVLFILSAQAVAANPYPNVQYDWSHDGLDKKLAQALKVVIDAGNYSAIRCDSTDAHDGVFAPVVNCSELSGKPLCGYRTWESLCRAWLVAPLSTTTTDLILEMSYMVFFLVIVRLGLAGNEQFARWSDVDDQQITLKPHHLLVLSLALGTCLLLLFYVCLTLLQLPMLMLGLPPANPGMMASEMYSYLLGTWLSVAAVLLLPIDTLDRYVKSRTNRGRSYFLSYKQDDGNDGAVQMLASLLTKGGSRVWLDKLAEDRSEKGMVKGVRESDIFVAVISKSYFASWFCSLEMRTALQEGKPVLVVWNQSKHTVQAALGWLPSDLSFLKNDELLPIQEDIQMAETCTYRIKAATVKPQERLMLYTLGEHVFEVGADSSEQGPEA